MGISPTGEGGITGISALDDGAGSGGGVGFGASAEIGGPLVTIGDASEGGGKALEEAAICGTVSGGGSA